MLKPGVHYQNQSIQSLFPLEKPFLHGNRPVGAGGLSSLLALPASRSRQPKVRVGFSPNNVRAISTLFTTTKTRVITAEVTVKQSVLGFITDASRIDSDDFRELWGTSLRLELISAELDPKTGKLKDTVAAYAKRDSIWTTGDIKYHAEFKVPLDFGDVGAIYVENENNQEMYVSEVVLDGLPKKGSVTITCNSWIHETKSGEEKRIFFTNKLYLPSQTPSGLVDMRADELKALRGNGEGKREKEDRIYDYDVYNDLGNPDKDPALKRPVLGSKELPYPRRCRTGRARSKKDRYSEIPGNPNYVPRDEAFSEIKTASFGAKLLLSTLHSLIPTIEDALGDSEMGFPYFTKIDELFNEGVNLPHITNDLLDLTPLPRLIRKVKDTANSILRFETPELMDKDKFSWLSDDEFARQTIAGINPLNLQLITEWPLKSTLDPEVYGPADSAITTTLLNEELDGFSITVEEALAQKKLFMLDYHDLLLPYVDEVRKLDGTTLYGSRTVFFLTVEGTLKPLAIELTRPKMDETPQWRKVYTASMRSTDCWLWRLAKCHVLVHDVGIHQLISHWLRTHCCVEPYVIATNRQLSAMHPIYKLLKPHLRYTMEINGLARSSLINAGGVIESTFFPGKYSMELSSVIYDKLWQFDLQALPKDLIHRGLAVEDPDSPHGLDLLIDDFPFANDGLMLWDILKRWVRDYVRHYYPESSLVESDTELQAWWSEIKNVGHGDKKNEPWWPELKTQHDLIEIVTTIAWVASGLHAAVNFGQYPYGGYFPNRPTIARINMPDEEPINEDDWNSFINKPESTLLYTFPTMAQAVKVMATIDTLSSHAEDEEYIGDLVEQAWKDDPVIYAAYQKFKGRMMELNGIVDARNGNPNSKNRNGAGVVPYQLLRPASEEPGVTGKGVPYSISI